MDMNSEKHIVITTVDSPLGPVTMASDGEALTGLCLVGQKYYASAIGAGTRAGECPVFDECRRWLDIYMGGKEPDFMPLIRLSGSDFRREVWEILRQIPYGKTMTYGQIAELIAKKRGLPRMSAQAVGGAVGHNPVSILVPCHRVLGSDGSLTGYAGGIELKAKLLELEGISFRR